MRDTYRDRYFAPGYQPIVGRVVAPSGWYGIGVDIGINNDFTVIAAIDRNTRKQVFYWRFCPGSSKNWHKNYDAMEWTFRYFRTNLRVDCGGSGASIPSEMPRRGVGLDPWGAGEDEMKLNEYNKPIIMDNLASLIGGKHIELFDLAEIKDELRKVQRRAKASGRGFDIAAPKGKNEHDDIAIALGLACIGVQPRLVNTSTDTTPISVGVPSFWSEIEW